MRVNNMKNLVLSCLVIVLLMCEQVVSAKDASNHNHDREKIMVVLDASGSMWGQINGTTKIELVREAYGALVKDWQAKPIDAGLIAYGHRRKGDCQDIEVLSEPMPVDAISLSEIVYRLTPKGKTPLGDAVRLAAKKLNFVEQKATVILLSDGVETCGIDSCQLGLELEEAGIDFTTHVIGLDIKTNQERQQLRCLADNTGGQYIDAKNAEDLSDALGSNSSLQPEAQVKSTLEIVGLKADLGEPSENTTWLISNRKGLSMEVITSTSEIKLNDHLPDLDEGHYIVKASSSVYSGLAEFIYPAEEQVIYLKLERDVPLTTIRVPPSVPAGAEFNVGWSGPRGKTDAVAIVETNKDFESHVGQSDLGVDNQVSLIAPKKAGEYEVIYVFDAYGKSRVDARVSILVTPSSVTLEPVGKIMAGKKFSVIWQGPGAEGDMIAIGPRTQGTDDYSSLTWLNENNQVTLDAPSTAGEYELRYFNQNYELFVAVPVVVSQ